MADSESRMPGPGRKCLVEPGPRSVGKTTSGSPALGQPADWWMPSLTERLVINKA